MSTASSTPSRAGAGRSPKRRLRWRFAMSATILLLAATISALLVGILGSRLSTRFDLTSTREHQLSPHTRTVLAKLDRPVELVLAGDFSQVDRGVRQRTFDVLEKFSRAGGSNGSRFKITTLDTGSPHGAVQYDELLKRLAEQAAPAVGKQRATVMGVIEAAESMGTNMAGIGESLQGIRDLLATAQISSGALETLRKYFDGEAAKCRSFAESMQSTAAKARTALEQPPEGVPVPPLDGIARLLRGPIAELAGGLPSLNSALDRFALTEGVPAEAAARAIALSKNVAGLRDRLARRVAEIDALEPLPIVTIARTIQRSRAALLIAEPKSDGNASGTLGERDLVAIDPDALLPLASNNPRGQNGPRLDERFRTEELIAAGLAALGHEIRPVAVFVHAGAGRLMPNLGPWGRVAARLGLRGIDANEWPVMVDEQPPNLTGTGAGGASPPVVYVIVGMELRRKEDAVRMSKLAAAAARLIHEGKNVLASAAPSTLPGSGAPDPMADFLEEVGIKPETGLLLMEEARVVGPAGQQRVVSPEFALVGPGASHAVSEALHGLVTYFPWAIPLKPAASPPAGVTVEPVLTKAGRPEVWAESEWQTLWQTPAEQRQRVPQPAMDSPRDQAAPPTGSAWWLAAAIERRSEALKGTQRVIVVGSPTWFFDIVADAQTVVDGKASVAAPGNIELLHASIAWLAGREDLIARSAEAMALPTIPELQAGQIAALRLALIGGLPIVVLIAGAVWRAWKG